MEMQMMKWMMTVCVIIRTSQSFNGSTTSAILRNGDNDADYTTARTSFVTESSEVVLWDSNRMVLVKDDGVWAGILNIGWTEINSMVFCKEMGYDHHVTLTAIFDVRRQRRYDVACTGNESSIYDCPFEDAGSREFDIRNSVRVLCYDRLKEYRLVGGSRPNRGTAEVYHDGKWGLLCDRYDFHDEKVSLLCKSLGYRGGELYPENTNVTGDYWATMFNCISYDPLLDGCTSTEWTFYSWNERSNPCMSSQPTTVHCYGDVRLSTRYDDTSGALLVYKDGEYKTVCADEFNSRAAMTACREMGFTSGGRVLPVSGYTSAATMLNVSLGCTGRERGLLHCQRRPVTCSSPTNIVNVVCSLNRQLQGSDGEVRVTEEGLVEVLYFGIWGAICSLFWGDEDARVVCKGAGYQHGKAYESFFIQHLPMWIYDIGCTGTESQLKDCSLKIDPTFEPSCPSRPLAAAYCYNSTSDSQYSLSGPNYGYVKLERNGTTGYLCDSQGFYNEGSTACRTLGFASGDLYSMRPPPDHQHWWMNRFNCATEPPVLDMCTFGDWTYVSSEQNSNLVDYCSAKALSVYCYGKLRLHTKLANTSGIVLHMSNRRYHSICTSGFDLKAADIVCTEIGFLKAKAVLPSSSYRSHYDVGYSGLNCSSSAESLADCDLVYDRNVSCGGGSAVIACDDGERDDIPDGLTRISFNGGIEISKFGVWGVINYDNWDNEDADVVCKQKGFELGKKKGGLTSALPVLIFDVRCHGNETDVLSCQYSTSGNIYGYIAGVTCISSSAVNDYELEFGHYGRLVKTTEGKTGYVCDSGVFSDEDAAVACRTKGFEWSVKYPSSPPSPEANWWVNTFKCSYWLYVLEECQESIWKYGQSYSDVCSRQEHVFSVYCYNSFYIQAESPGPRGVIIMTANNIQATAVCRDHFTETEGRVACREAGFPGYVRLISASEFPKLSESNLSIRDGDYSCRGDERSLSECTVIASTCLSKKLAAVECEETNSTISIADLTKGGGRSIKSLEGVSNTTSSTGKGGNHGNVMAGEAISIIWNLGLVAMVIQ